MKTKNNLANISLFIFSIIFILFILEAVLRIGHLQSDLFGDLDNCTGWKRIPGKSGYNVSRDFKTFVEINDEGFRDVNHEVEKQGKFRILFLGDSFTEAIQVPIEKTSFKILEEQLNQTYENIEVLSLGVSSFGTDQELLSLKCYGLKYKPDIVILNFFSGNDIKNNYFDKSMFNPEFSLNSENKLELDYTYKEDVEKRIQKRKTLSVWSFLVFVKDHSHLARFINEKTNIIKHKKRREQQANSNVLFYNEYTNDWNSAWELTKVLIKEVQRVSKESDADFLLVNIPVPVQIAEEESSMLDSSRYNINKPNELLSEFVNSEDMYYLDLLPIFNEKIKTTGKKVSWEHDSHWNEYGNEIAAESIHDYIMENNLIK